MPDRISQLLVRFLDAPVPVDILPLTASEICRRLEDPSPFWIRIWLDKVLLAGILPPGPESAACS